jgi:hypothetical protein
MDIKINSKEELIDFVNRKNVTIEDALKVAEQCFGVVPIVFVNRENGELTYSKKDIIDKIQDIETKHIWLMT